MKSKAEILLSELDDNTKKIFDNFDDKEKEYVRICIAKGFLQSDNLSYSIIYIQKAIEYNKKQKMKVEKEISNYLTAKDYAKGDKIEMMFLDAGKINLNGKFGKTYEFKVSMNKVEKVLSLSGKNFNEVIDKYGDETENWVNKFITLLVVSSDKSVSGKSFQVI